MDQALKKIILGYILETDSDGSFTDKINALHLREGDVVYQALFKILAGIDIPQEKSEEYWLNVLEHRREIMQLLGRNIDITTALSDYLQTATNFLDHPRLIEAGYYENIVKETIHDKLTGLFNRPYFDEAYNQQVSLAKRYQQILLSFFWI